MSKRTAGKQAAQKATDWVWQKQGTLIYGTSNYVPKKLILGFDMDDTLIKTASGAKFAKDSKDWKWWCDKVIETIKDYSKKDYGIVIFSNQNGITKGHTKQSDLEIKIQDMQAQLDVPMAAFLASDDDIYRKPRQEMWTSFLNLINDKIPVNLKDSIYCGDAAGRLKPKKDFSDSDLKFAINIGLQFKTPEQLFLKQDLKEDYIKLIGFNPKSLPKEGPLFKGFPETKFIKPAKPEMIIMIGAPGSGKSTFVTNHLKDYTRVNRDTLKTREKCLKVAEQAMQQEEYVVIDNTNPTAQDRKAFIELAKDYDYPCRSFYIDIPKDLAFHNDTQRDANKHRQHLSKRVGQVPIHTFYKYFEQPTTKEGFEECRAIQFIAGPFHNEKDEEVFFSFVKGK